MRWWHDDEFSDGYNRLHTNEPLHYKALRRRWESAIAIVVILLAGLYCYKLLDCYSKTGESRMCRLYADAEAVDRAVHDEEKPGIPENTKNKTDRSQ